MNVQISSLSLSSAYLMEIARERNWQDAFIFGRGPVPVQEVSISGWLILPFDQYQGEIPEWVINRKRRVEATMPVKAWLIADDERKVKMEAMTVYEPPKPETYEPEPPDIDFSRIAHVGLEVLTGTAKVGLTVLTGLAVVTGAILLAVFRFDPLLVCVLEDGTWVAVASF